MKKKIFAALLSLSIIVGISAVGLLAEAAEYCPHNNSVYTGYVEYYYYINPREHGYISYFEYWCRDCDEFYAIDDYGFVEDHDYSYDYSTGEFVCDICGDRYQ